MISQRGPDTFFFLPEDNNNSKSIGCLPRDLDQLLNSSFRCLIEAEQYNDLRLANGNHLLKDRRRDLLWLFALFLRLLLYCMQCVVK